MREPPTIETPAAEERRAARAGRADARRGDTPTERARDAAAPRRSGAGVMKAIWDAMVHEGP